MDDGGVAWVSFTVLLLSGIPTQRPNANTHTVQCTSIPRAGMRDVNICLPINQPSTLAAQLQILPRHPDEYLQGDHSFTVSFSPIHLCICTEGTVCTMENRTERRNKKAGFCQQDWASWAGIFKQSMGARNRVGTGLLYRPARLHRLAEFIPWNRCLGSINV